MHRFFLPPDRCQGPRLHLREAESHHAFRVLRVQEGEEVIALDGAGRSFNCRVIAASKSSVTLEVIQSSFTPPPPAEITLIAGIPKGQLLDGMVEQATELGVSTIVPLVTDRGNVRLDPEAAAAKQEKWQITAIEAIKQCGSRWLPKVLRPISLKAFLNASHPCDLALFAALHPSAVEIRTAFQAFTTREKTPPRRVAIWVGPEGDFTPEEVTLLIQRGVQPITLGTLVLRCPTAAISGLAVVAQELRLAYPGPYPGR